MFAPYIDFNFLADICKLRRQECEADIFLKEGRGASAGHFADFPAVDIHVAAIAGDARFGHLEPGDFTLHAFARASAPTNSPF